MENINLFSSFIEKIQKQIDQRQITETYQTNYNLKKFKITEISAKCALQMFQHIVQKFYKNHSPGESGTWVQNQLRLYIWAVICYIELYGKELSNFAQQDWDFFSKIFFVKEYNLFEYQAKILLDLSIKTAKWTQQEDYMLYCIITKQKAAKWNQIAKTMFIRSNKKYLRASKQCRERWFNHLDPSKIKSQWNLMQYLIIFQHVQEKGKKWALIVKSLKQRRSQHSIKNKYNSIVKKQLKLTPELTEQQICRQLIIKMQRIIDNYQIQANDDYLFGCSLKLYKNQCKGRDNELNKIQLKQNCSKDQKSINRFEIFRKKIQNFQSDPIPSIHNCSTQTSYKQEQQKKCKPEKKHNTFKFYNSRSTMNKMATSWQLKDDDDRLDYKLSSQFEFEKQRDQIFYEDSLDANQLSIPQNFDIFRTDDIKDIADQYGFDR